MNGQYPQGWIPPSQQYPPIPVRQMQNGYGVAGLTLGILALIFSIIPFIGVIAWPLAILGVIFGVLGIRRVARRQANNNGAAITGVALSGVALLVCFAWLAVLGSASTARPSASAGSAATYPASRAAVPLQPVEVPATQAPATGPRTTFTDGENQLVGEDIEPGEYKTAGPPADAIFQNCYYSINSTADGSFGSIVSNGNSQGPGRITLKKGRYVSTSGGCEWVRKQ